MGAPQPAWQPDPTRRVDNLEAIRDQLRASGYEFSGLVNCDSRLAFLAAAPLILDGYLSYSRHERNIALLCLYARIPEPHLAERLYDVLIAEGKDAREFSAQWMAGRALVGLCGSKRDRMLEFAADDRLGIARAPIILALAKRRDVRVVPLVEGALREPELRATGLEAVGLMRLHAFAPEVHDSLHDSDVNNREQARKALKRLQDGKT